MSYFVTGSYLEEDGWRDFSPTEATQLFGNLGWRVGDASIDASVTYVDTDLIGNGAAPEDCSSRPRSDLHAARSNPERAHAAERHRDATGLRELWTLTGNVYVRKSDIDTLNGDDSDFEECEDDPGFICEEEDDEEEIVLDENGDPIPADDELEGATVNRTGTEQIERGLRLPGRLLRGR